MYYFQRAITSEAERMEFQFLKVERQGLHVDKLHFHKNQMLRSYGALNKSNVIFPILVHHFEL